MKDEATESYFCTGVLATADEIATMKGSYSTPVIVIANRVPASPGEIIHAIALRHGLPEIKGYYGCDFRDGEFIREKDAHLGEPDRWPSRKLDDILADTLRGPADA